MKVNCKVSNKTTAYFITIVIILTTIITVTTPLFLLYYFPSSKIAMIFFSFPSICIFIFGMFVLFYFLAVGIYHFEFKADQYIIMLKSRRVIFSYLSSKVNFLEMPNSSIMKFTFFNRPFTFNTTLMIKLKVSSRRAIAKRFNFAFLRKQQQEALRDTLERIIQHNNLNESREEL